MLIPRKTKSLSIEIYKKARKEGIIKGRDKNVVAVAVVYTAIRLLDLPIPLDSVAKASGIRGKDIGRIYRDISKKLHLEITPVGVEKYIMEFSEGLNLSEEAKITAMEIYQQAREKEILSGKSPPGVAAGILYIASILSNDRKTQKEIGQIAGVTEVTVRNRFKEIEKKLEISLPSS